MVIDARHRLATVRKPPYDAEIEYLDTNGTAYVDIGIDSGDNVGFEVEATRINETTSDSVLFGTRHDTGDTRWFVGAQYNGMYYWGWNTRIDSQTLKLNEKHSLGLNFLNSRTCTFDGNVVGNITSTYQYGKRLYFCAYHTRDDAIQISSTNCWRIHGGKISVDNTLIRDLIPVRFTNELGHSEGAMYDKVSGQLFKNQGSGEFVMGPDVAPAPYVVTYRKPFVSFTPPPPSARDYISDGLIAMWDGIENAGWRTHDDNAIVWNDLIGANDITLTMGGGRWLEIGLFLAKTPRTTGLFSTDETTYKQIEVVGVELTSTLELDRHFLISFNANHNFVVGQNRIGFCTANNVASVAPTYPSSTNRKDVPYSVSVGYTESNVPDINAMFYNGLNYPATGSAITIGGTTKALNNYVGSRDYRADSNLYCVRLYSRALTAEEIAHNYAIDKIRFNLP